MRSPFLVLITPLFALALACSGQPTDTAEVATDDSTAASESEAGTTSTSEAQQVVDKYTSVPLTYDVSQLSENQRRMLSLFIEAADEMDAIFWQQAYGDREELLADIDDEALRRAVEINYGPWDRLAGNEPFVPGAGAKPDGANFYPAGLSKDELEAAAANNPALTSLYTMVRRNADGGLRALPYSQAFADGMTRAAAKLEEAAALAEEPGLKRYLELRAEALRSDDYQPSDLAWMEMKDNTLDLVIGPIETYEDKLVGAKAAAEAYVLVKDRAWSDRLARYAALLPGLQEGLPVPPEYKRETPGSDSDLGAYDVLYYAGDCNAGSKTIAINLPNDEEVQLARGTRRLQLKNAMRAKFDVILVPIAGELIAEDQRPHITFDAFFANTMFHEVAHGLGIKNTIDGSGTVREALAEKASIIEEGKADVLGLYMVSSLAGQGELGEVDLTDYQVTFVASIFRSIRFGSASAHGVTNLIRFNFFEEQGAIVRDEATGTYRVDEDKATAAMNALSEQILRLQGDGDYDAVVAFIDRYGQQGEQLTEDLARLGDAGIPVDIVFEQGAAVLGL